MKAFLAIAGGAPMEVELQEAGGADPDLFILRRGDQREEIEVRRNGTTSGLIHRAGRTLEYHAIRADRSIRVWVDGHIYDFQLATPGAGRRAVHAVQTEELKAPMPGTVLQVRVAEGEAFTAAQPLVIMESMKMEMTLSAPHSGRVGKILCTPGQMVDAGATLVRFASAIEP